MTTTLAVGGLLLILFQGIQQLKAALEFTAKHDTSLKGSIAALGFAVASIASLTMLTFSGILALVWVVMECLGSSSYSPTLLITSTLVYLVLVTLSIVVELMSLNIVPYPKGAALMSLLLSAEPATRIRGITALPPSPSVVW